MIIEDFIPTKEDLLEEELIKERNELIKPLHNQLQRDEISGQEYHDRYDKIIEEYDKKIKEIDNE